jgi:hypothetical protein
MNSIDGKIYIPYWLGCNYISMKHFLIMKNMMRQYVI